MTLTMTCRHCGAAISGDNEDDFVDKVQDHHRINHGGPELPRDRILKRLHRQQRNTEDAATE